MCAPWWPKAGRCALSCPCPGAGMSWPGELRVIGTDIRKLHSFRAGESIHPHHRSLRSCVPPDSRSTRACTPRPRTNHAGVSLAFQGENRAQRRRGSHVVLRLRQQLLRRARTRVAAFGPLISARRSDTRSVDLQCTRSCRHFPQCHPCARFGPFGIRHLVQPAELRLAAFTGLPPSDVPEPVLHGLRALRSSSRGEK